jgi:hypothetical protein
MYHNSPTDPGFNNDDDLLSPILPNLLRTIPSLNCLTIVGDSCSMSDWNTLDSSLTSAFLYLMHLPTINHIDLSYIENFPLSSLTSSVNLHRLDILSLKPLEKDDSLEIVVQSEMMPKIRDFHTLESTQLTTKLLHAERQDGRPAFNFMDLRRLSTCFKDEQNLRYLLHNAKLLEELRLSFGLERSLVELYDILSPIARTLKVLNLTVYSHSDPTVPIWLCEELEAMAGHIMLESLFFHIHADGGETEDFVLSLTQEVEKVLVKPEWSALRQVTFKVSISWWLVSREDSEKLSEALQSIPDKYLSYLPKLESVAFNYSVHIDKYDF